MMSALPTLGIRQASVTAGNALTRLQLSRLAKESARDLVVQFSSDV